MVVRGRYIVSDEGKAILLLESFPIRGQCCDQSEELSRMLVSFIIKYEIIKGPADKIQQVPTMFKLISLSPRNDPLPVFLIIRDNEVPV